MADNPVTQDFNERFARTAHNVMFGEHGPAGLAPEDAPAIDTSVPVVEPSHLASTPVFSKHVVQSPTVLNTAGKTPQSREEAMNAEKRMKGNLPTFDFSQEPVKETSTAMGMPNAAEAVGQVIRSTVDPIKAAWYKSRMDNIGTRRMIGLATDDDLKELDALTKSYNEFSGTEPSMVGEAAAGLVPLGEQALAGSALAASSLGAIKPQWGFGLAAGMMAGGAMFNRLKNTQMTDGRPIDDSTARGAALIVSAINTAAFVGGEAAISSGFKSLVAKFGGGKVAAAGMEKLVERAATSPQWASKLAALAKFDLKGVGVIKAYGVLGEIADALGQDIAGIGKPEVPSADLGQMRDNIVHTLVDPKETAVQALIAGSFAPFAKPWLQARENAHAIEARDQTLPILQSLANGEAGKAPDHLRAMVTDMQETHDPDGPTENVEIAAQKVREIQRDNGGGPLHPDVDSRLVRAEKGGGVAVLPTGDHTAYVLTQKDSEKLGDFTRFGEAPTLEEDPKIAEALKKAKEPNPIDVGTEKVANDIRAKSEAPPDQADLHAEILSSFVRATSIDRARSLGIEPQPFEDYARTGPLETIGGREKSLQSFESGIERLTSTTDRERRLAGTEEAAPKKSKLERTQDLVRKTFGEQFIVFRKDAAGPEGYGAGKASLSYTEGSTPVYIRPEDVTGATKGSVETGQLDLSRVKAVSPEQGKQLFTEEGRKGAIKMAEEEHGGIRGATLTGGPFITMLQSGKADASTFFHEMGHYIHNYLKEFDPARAEALLGKNPDKATFEQFANYLEQYFIEGKAPNPGMQEMYQHISRLMRSAYGKADLGLTISPELRRTFDRLFALQEEVQPAVQALAPGAEHGILEPKQYLEYEGLVKDYETKALENVSEAAGKFDRKAAREELQRYKEYAEEAVVRDDVNNAVSWLKDGRTLDGREIGLEGKLDPRLLKGEGVDPADLPKGLTEKGGLDPADVAAAFGIRTNELLDGLQNWTPLEDQIAERAHDIFSRANPGWLAEDDWVKATGIKAAINKALGKVQAFNLRTLGAKMGFKGDEGKALLLAIKNDVSDTLRTATKRDLKPNAYYRAIIQQTATMREEWSKGNFREAYEAAAQAARAKEMYEQVRELKDDTNKRVARVSNLASDENIRAKVNLGGKEYQVLMDWALQALGFAPPDGVTPQALGEAVQALRDRDEPFNLPLGYDQAWGLDGSKGGWKSLGSDMLHDALDMAEVAAYRGQQANKLRIRGELVDRTTYVRGLIDKVEPIAKKRGILGGIFLPPTKELNLAEKREPHPLRRSRLFLNSLALDLTKMEGELKIIDGETAGPMHQAIYQPVADGTFRFEKEMEPQNKQYKDRWTKRAEADEDWQARSSTTVTLPDENGTPIKISDVARNLIGILGDKGARNLLFRNNNLEFNKVIPWLNDLLHKGLLIPEDIEKYHGDQEQMDSHYEKMADIKEKESGVRPSKVPASPYMLQGKDGPILVKGGYWGYDYDYGKSQYLHTRDVGNQDPLQGSMHRTPGQDTSMTQERTVQGRTEPLRLEAEVVLQRIESIVRYNELREPLQEVQKVLTHPEMREFLDENYRGAYKLGMDWQSAIGSRGLVPDARGPANIQKITRFVHQGQNNFLLAGRFGGAIHILGSIGQGMNDTGALNMAKGASRVLFSTFTPGMENEFKRIEGLSDEVKTLSHTFSSIAPSLVNDQIEALSRDSTYGSVLRGSEAYKEAYRKYALFWYKVTSRAAQTFVYAGAENKAEQNLQERGIPLGTPEADAYTKNFSEAALRQSHGASGTKDTARAFQDKSLGFAFFSYVNSYRSSLFQHVREQGYELGRGEYGKWFSNVMYNFVLPGAWSAIVRGAWVPLLGLGAAKAISDNEKAKYAMSMFIHSTMNQYFGAFPIVGDVVSYGLSKLGLEQKVGLPSTDAATKFFGDPLAVPVGRSVNRLLQHRKQWEDAGSVDWEDFSYDLAELGGVIPYSPTRGLSSGMAFLHRYYNGEISPKDAEFTRDLISPMSKRPAK